MQITELSASRLRNCRIHLHATDQSQRIKQLQCIIILDIMLNLIQYLFIIICEEVCIYGWPPSYNGRCAYMGDPYFLVFIFIITRQEKEHYVENEALW